MVSLMAKLTAPVMLVLLAFAALMAWVELDAPISSVRVEGQLDEAERASIRHAVAAQLRSGSGILSTDLDLLQQAIRDLSWPRHVTVRRLWPDGLVVSVDKEMVVAAWRDAYLNTEGKVVQWPGARADLPIFDCQVSQPRAAMEIYQRLNDATAPVGLRIERLAQNELGEWTVNFATGIKLILGAERLTQRVARFLVVYERELAQKEDLVEQVDARYANGVAVRWRQPLRGEPTVLAALARSQITKPWRANN
jgi:cell division protein FtsQ